MADKFVTLKQLLDMLDNYNHKELHVHHTWIPNHDNFTTSNWLALQAGMRNYHMKNNNWSDIAQHITLFPDGRMLTGRSFGRTPASIKGYNTGAFMVEMIGNFDRGNDNLTGKQREMIIGIARYFNKKNKYIRFHRENASKTCPGTGVDKAKFMKDVRSLTTKPETPNNNLRYGSRGKEVTQLQKDLKRLGYNVTVSGGFGNEVSEAVQLFQSRHKGVKRSGEVDETTARMIKEDLDKLILRKGSRGKDVTQLQKDLKYLGYDVTVRGGFGEEVEKAVTKFQSRHLGVRRSGEVDETTQRMIKNDLKAVQFYKDNK